ncbi:thermostable hemolysin [Pantoea sp. JGM49]|uniref:thermostable hemolysin n=1 Tax=unclassified Pantoea TaxID=2630326 RepID=UPI000BD0E751|nr:MULTISPECIES: thermostable hemolysin [unclassified Pantoea]MBS0883644.1 thermostable hemolysin [Pantoea sp. JGM49]MDI9280068.1 thermostable hemolysin [Pantoea sp. EABMAA-21]SNY79278.1 Thermostable hemolysin [Pantoea sp. GL120224-02]
MLIHFPCKLIWRLGGNESSTAGNFIREHYFRRYGAELSSLLPDILTLEDGRGCLIAACGMAPASAGMMYLERYLDRPAEGMLSDIFKGQIFRSSIVEIGNFAATDGLAVRVFYAAICRLLNHYGYSHIVFTGTRKIRNTFCRMNLHPVVLADAEGERLGSEKAQWGSYYLNAPKIMAGELAGGQLALANNDILNGWIEVLPDSPWHRIPEVQHAH